MKGAEGLDAAKPNAPTAAAAQLSLSVKKATQKTSRGPRTGRSTVRSQSSGPDNRSAAELAKWSAASFSSQRSMAATERANLIARLKRNPVFEKRICGDVFGTTLLTERMEGLLYRSRMVPDNPFEPSTQPEAPAAEDPILQKSRISLDYQDDDSAESDHIIDETMTPDQRLARTLCNWSKHEANASRMLDDGAVDALIALGSLDDIKIKEDVASGLYYLTCKPENRLQLLYAGAAATLVQIAMATKHWRTAKVCACALSHLSMHQGGEEIMGKEGAVLAAVILLGMRNHRLGNICLHTLYNLTCVQHSYAGVERISRSLLGMSSIVHQDARPLILKGICNCARFSALRVRILEDGVLQLMASTLHSYTNSANNNAADITDVNCIASCLRLLSESKSSRNEIIAKGGIEILRQLLPFSDDSCRPQMVQALHNILAGNQTQVPYSRPTALRLVYELSNTDDLASIRHLAGLIYWLLRKEAKQECCELLSAPLQRFIATPDAVAQTFAALACASIFQQDFTRSMVFSDSDEPDTLLEFAINVVDKIATLALSDPRAVEAFSAAIWRICEVKAIREVMKSTDHLEKTVQLLLNLATTDVVNVQVYFCLSVCALTDVLDDLKPSHRGQVASILLKLLCSEEASVYAHAVGGIYRVVEKRLCDDELLSPTTVQRLVHIGLRAAQDDNTRQICCAILAALSYNDASHQLLGEAAVIQALFKTGLGDGHNTQMTVAVCICNLSANPEYRDVLLDNDVINALTTLSATGSESVQKLCAIAYCNLTCLLHRHRDLFNAGALTSLLMIALVRAVGKHTKQICAQALLNFISGDCMPQLISEGIVRAFATLSFVECETTQSLCAHAFVVLSCGAHGRMELANHRNVLKAVFGLIRCQSRQTNVMLTRTLCNLLAHEESKLPVLQAGALGVLRIVGTLPIQDVQEDCIKIITMLGHQPDARPFLLKEDILSVLILYIRSADATLFERAVEALSALSAFKDFRQELVSLGCAGAIVHAVLSGKATSSGTIEQCVQCLRYLSSTEAEAQEILRQNTIIALHMLWRIVSTAEEHVDVKLVTAKHISMILKNLSCLPQSEEVFVRQQGLELAEKICQAVEDDGIGLTAAVITYHMVRDERMHEQVVNSGIIRALRNAASTDAEFAYFATSAIQRLTTTEACRPLIARQDVCAIFERLTYTRDEASKLPMAQALRNLAGCKQCRKLIVDQGAVEILMQLSESDDEETQKACSDAMSFLSEFTNLQAGAVDVLLKISPGQHLQAQLQSGRSQGRMTRTNSFYQRIDQHSVIGVSSPGQPSTPRSRGETKTPEVTPDVAANGPLVARKYEQLQFASEEIQATPAGGAPQVDISVEHSIVSSPSLNVELAEIGIEAIPSQMAPYAKFVTQYEIGALNKFLIHPPEPPAPVAAVEEDLPVETQPFRPVKTPGARARFLKRFSRTSLSKIPTTI